MKKAKYLLYESIYDLPLSKFIDCLCDQKLSSLCKEGVAPDEALFEKWANIYAEYLDLSEAHEMMYMLEMQKDILLLQSKISEVEASTHFLMTAFNHTPLSVQEKNLVERLCRIIQNNGFDISDTAYERQLPQITALLAPDKLRLQEMTAEFERYSNEQETKSIDRKFFVRMLNALAKFQGVATINPDQIMTANYVLLVKDYVDRDGTPKEDDS